MDYKIPIKGDYHNTLDMEGFSLMMKNPSYCYKFYWLEAIVQLISEGKTEATFDEIITEMIVNAWYSVVVFHIHLSGIVLGEARDGLERAVYKLADLGDLDGNSPKVKIRNEIKRLNNELKKEKMQLTNMVPYRSLAGFFAKSEEIVPWDSTTRVVQYTKLFDEKVERLPYVFDEKTGLNRTVYFNPKWVSMIQENTVAILGWIQYEKVKWLQTNNPEVPGLVFKLNALDEKVRKLEKVRLLWADIMQIHVVKDVFTGNEIGAEYDVDHFIPWSFVMNDELWDLSPMDSNLNSSKGNRLPDWNSYFKRFAFNQFQMYQDIYQYEAIHKRFVACYKDNLHSIWANQELYRPGNEGKEFYKILEKNMKPVYDSAKRQGYTVWRV